MINHDTSTPYDVKARASHVLRHHAPTLNTSRDPNDLVEAFGTNQMEKGECLATKEWINNFQTELVTDMIVAQRVWSPLSGLDAKSNKGKSSLI